MRSTNLIHPGEILLEEFLIPLGVSQNKLAISTLIPTTRINSIVQGKRSITADTAIRLGKFFGTGPEFWLNLQANYDLGLANAANGQDYERILTLPNQPTEATTFA